MGSKRHRNGTSQARLEREARQRRLEHSRTRVRRRLVIGGAVLVIVAALVAVIVAGSGDSTSTAPYDGTTLEVSLGDFTIRGQLTAPAGLVRLHARNEGGASHNVGIRRGPISTNLAPGEDTMLDLGRLEPGTYELYCDITDHVQRGMVAQLVITAA